MTRFLRQYFAHRRLNKLVEQERQSFACEQFRRRRAAALKGIGRTPKPIGS